MKKVFLLCFLSLILIGSTPLTSFSQTLDDIVKKMIEAQGGEDVIKSIKDMTMTGSLEIPEQNLSISFTQYKKEPDKRRMKMEVMGTVQIQCFDGKTAWEINPQTGKTEEILGEDAEDIKRGSLALEWILYPEKYGISLALKEKERIEGKDYFVLEQGYPDGEKVNLYVNPDTYLIYKMRGTEKDQMGVEVETEAVMSGYKSVEGYMVAHSMIIFMEGKKYMKMIFNKVQVNTGLEDDLFMMKK